MFNPASDEGNNDLDTNHGVHVTANYIGNSCKFFPQVQLKNKTHECHSTTYYLLEMTGQIIPIANKTIMLNF